MSIDKKEFSTKEKYWYEPMESTKLNDTFSKNKVENIDGIRDSIIAIIWENNPFVEALNARLKYVNATVMELIEHKDEIKAANNRSYEWSNLIVKEWKKRAHKTLREASV